jgi:hypothetical protein
MIITGSCGVLGAAIAKSERRISMIEDIERSGLSFV